MFHFPFLQESLKMRNLNILLLALLVGVVVSQRNRYSGGGRGNGGGRWNDNNGNSNRGCGSGWQRFNRPSGGWCIKVFRGEHTQSGAESRCQNVGARLTGVQSQSEIQYITRSALNLISQSSGSVWLGARRTSQCSTSKLSTSCSSMNSFRWTDGSTTGTAGLIWNTNQPDNAHAQQQQCMVVLATRGSSVTDQWTWYGNRLDDVNCAGNVGENAVRTIRAYACGKRA
ncbi:hypothetical protein L3Y34_016560 [Caenorhabditis briggsae]|uniref:C-type lectin domain-containing protein n=2 Tax=Caenorhabditis briggsae TaxID=6238 RepID=A0AAE9DXK7_CAEBR|nr:hypothetical protein L3Y34_016560 [Caenorhabditis briggsae]